MFRLYFPLVFLAFDFCVNQSAKVNIVGFALDLKTGQFFSATLCNNEREGERKISKRTIHRQMWSKTQKQNTTNTQMSNTFEMKYKVKLWFKFDI